MIRKFLKIRIKLRKEPFGGVLFPFKKKEFNLKNRIVKTSSGLYFSENKKDKDFPCNFFYNYLHKYFHQQDRAKHIV